MLPQQWVLGAKVPFPESNTVEFKRVAVFSGLFTQQTKHSSGLPKYKETLNAFLNSSGGYLIMGILDDGTIMGVDGLTEEARDKFNLWVDSCFNSFVYKDGSPLDPTRVFLKAHIFPVVASASATSVILASATSVILASATSVIVVEAINKGPPLNIMNRDGTILYRLNASNYKITAEPVYRKRDVRGMISAIKDHMQKIIDEKHRAIQDLQEKHHLEVLDYIDTIREYEKRSLCSQIFALFGC
jgi:hypothetical protein